MAWSWQYSWLTKQRGPPVERDADLKKRRNRGRGRAKFMTVGTMAIGLVPILGSTSTCADLMNRSPSVWSADWHRHSLWSCVYPVVYMMWKRRELNASQRKGGGEF